MNTPEAVATVTIETFSEEVGESSVPVLVECWAPECGPCVLMKPIIEELAEEYAGRLRVVKMNTREEPELIEEFGLQGVPSLILFNDGLPLERLTGLLRKADLKSWINGHLGL